MWIDAPLPPWWRDLFAPREILPSSYADEVVAAGDGGLRAVCAVLDPRHGELRIPRSTPRGRELCAQLLKRFARPALVPWLLERMLDRDGEDFIAPHLAEALAACGPTAAEAACAAYADSAPGDAVRPWLAEVAAHAGVKSDACLAVLVSCLQDDPLYGAQLLADYGDASAVPALQLEFDRTPTDGPDADPQTLTTLGVAIQTLGGELDASRQRRLVVAQTDAGRLALAQRRLILEKAGFGGSLDRPAPEDPCPCESGAAYAHCCESIESEMVERFNARTARPYGHDPG